MGKHIFKIKDKLTNINLTPYLLIASSLLILVLLLAYPFFRTIQISFYDYRLTIPQEPFVGFENYIKIFKLGFGK